MKWLSELFKSKREKDLERILSRHYGGLYKRIDENRELMELLQAQAPEFLAAHPWVRGWLESTDGFLVDLEKAAPPLDAQFKPQQSATFIFPRRMEGKDGGMGAEQVPISDIRQCPSNPRMNAEPPSQTSKVPVWALWLRCVLIRGGHRYGRWWWPTRDEAHCFCEECADLQTSKNRHSWLHRERPKGLIYFGYGAETPEPIIGHLNNDGAGHYHTMILGTTGRGKSAILQAEADRLGITCDELLKRMEPTPEQKEQKRILEQEQKQKKAARFTAVCEAYWASSTEEDSDLYVLHDALACAEIVAAPTREQQKALLLMLPSDIVGQGIAWGFSDTEVRGSIHSFIDENRDAVVERIESAV